MLADFTVPGADAVANALERDVIGNKADTASTTLANTTSLMRYIKGILNNTNSQVALTTFTQETVAATDVDGVTWKDLLDKSALAKYTEICGFMVTKAGAWAGVVQLRIVDGAGNKIFPFQAQYVEVTDFTSAVQATFNFPVKVPAASGYKFQFRSSNAGDGAGETLALNNLDVITYGWRNKTTHDTAK